MMQPPNMVEAQFIDAAVTGKASGQLSFDG